MRLSAGQQRPERRSNEALLPVGGWFGDHLPGRTGRRPPSASMASPMRAAGWWNPKAIRVMTLILVFTDSIRPLLSPWSRVAWMLGRWRRIFSPSSVNSGMRQRAAQGGPGSPGESHPEAPTEPCLTVSRYTALLIESVRTRASTPSGRIAAALFAGARSTSVLLA